MTETWYPPDRRWPATLYALLSGIWAIQTIVRIRATGDAESTGGLPWVVYAFLAAGFALQTWIHLSTRVRADHEGVHVRGPHGLAPMRTRTYPWQDIVTIRPGRTRINRTFLALVRRGGRKTVHLPITDEHLDALRRWHAAAT